MTREQYSSQRVEVLGELERALGTRPSDEALRGFTRILRERFDHYNWVGLYLIRGGNLELAAYSGDAETEHTTIPIGEGVCGYAAREGKTVVVPDVSKDARYLMCFPSTRSEIVVPIKGKTDVIGEIDIDSDKLAAFSPDDEQFLEAAARQLAEYLEGGKRP